MLPLYSPYYLTGDYIKTTPHTFFNLTLHVETSTFIKKCHNRRCHHLQAPLLYLSTLHLNTMTMFFDVTTTHLNTSTFHDRVSQQRIHTTSMHVQGAGFDSLSPGGLSSAVMFMLQYDTQRAYIRNLSSDMRNLSWSPTSQGSSWCLSVSTKCRRLRAVVLSLTTPGQVTLAAGLGR